MRRRVGDRLARLRRQDPTGEVPGRLIGIGMDEEYRRDAQGISTAAHGVFIGRRIGLSPVAADGDCLQPGFDVPRRVEPHAYAVRVFGDFFEFPPDYVTLLLHELRRFAAGQAECFPESGRVIDLVEHDRFVGRLSKVSPGCVLSRQGEDELLLRNGSNGVRRMHEDGHGPIAKGELLGRLRPRWFGRFAPARRHPRVAHGVVRPGHEIGLAALEPRQGTVLRPRKGHAFRTAAISPGRLPERFGVWHGGREADLVVADRDGRLDKGARPSAVNTGTCRLGRPSRNDHGGKQSRADDTE